MVLPFQVKNQYHFLQSRGCTRRVMLVKSRLRASLPQLFKKTQIQAAAVPHTPCYPKHLFPLAQIPGNDTLFQGALAAENWLCQGGGILFSSGTVTPVCTAELKQGQSREGRVTAVHTQLAPCYLREHVSCTLNFTTPRYNVTQAKQSTLNNLVCPNHFFLTTYSNFPFQQGMAKQILFL